MHEEGKASTTISHYLVSLHRFFDFCVKKMGLMEKNLISTEDIPIPKPRDKERPDLDQIKKAAEQRRCDIRREQQDSRA